MSLFTYLLKQIQIFRTSMFGNTLSEVMVLQKDRFPNRQLPWVQVALSQQVPQLFYIHYHN